jgi:5S rRNA maturation endonuclease (ribonuclease M5)
MNIGYDKRRKAVTIPWYFPDGRLANVKYRRVDSKIFWYEKGGYPIRSLLYGMNVIYRKGIKRAVITEAEIDSMTWMTAGFPSIASGGSNFTNEQADAIARSPIEELYIAADNDEAGEKFKAQVVEKLSGRVNLFETNIPKMFKDANEVKPVDKLNFYVKDSKIIPINENKLLIF